MSDFQYRLLGALAGALDKIARARGRYPSTQAAQATRAATYTLLRALRDVRGPREDSDWDPEPLDEQVQASHCKAFLLEILRRAAHDWVLYRQHQRMDLKEIAQHAYTWLFEEGPGHPWWTARRGEGRMLTSFLVICESMDLDPEVVRARVQKMDIKAITGVGRPAERRRPRSSDDDVQCDEHSADIGVDVYSYGDSPNRSSYENHYAVATLNYS